MFYGMLWYSFDVTRLLAVEEKRENHFARTYWTEKIRTAIYYCPIYFHRNVIVLLFGPSSRIYALQIIFKYSIYIKFGRNV